MENASKALVIAGGILLAMLTISLLFLLLSNINSSKMTEEEKLAAKQLQEFNQQWEAYNKKVLYGTDVISVLNKAMDNNSKASVEDDTNKYYVNVKVNLKKGAKKIDFTTKITKLDLKTGITSSVEFIPANVTGTGSVIKAETLNLSSSDELELGNWKDNDTLIVNNQINQAVAALSGLEDEYKDIKNQTIYYVDSPLKVFKTTVFKCTNIEYVEGRVHQIEFEIK